MKKRHIAFISMPRTSHVTATLPIISVLVRRGHRVTCAISERFSSRVTHLGAEYLPIPPLDMGNPNDGICDFSRCTLTDTAPLFEAEKKPDLIIYDFVTLAGRVLAHRWRIPAIQISPHPAFTKEALAEQVKNRALRERVLGASQQADDFLKGYGVPSSGYIFHREKLNIYLFPRDFDPVGRAADDSCLYAGRCPGEQPYFGDWRTSASDRKPTVLVITSTTHILGPEYFSMCIEALSDMPCNVILFPGDDSKLAPLPLPANFQHVRGTSAAKALASSAVLICTGGATTASEAAYHGVPLVMTSCGGVELEGLCERWAHLGLGIHLKQEAMNAESLRSAVNEATTNPEILRRVRQMQCTVQREPGGEEVANVVEEFMEGYCV